MRARLLAGTLALCATLASLPGCSFVLVQGPPRGRGQPASFSCTRSNAVPVVDAVLAGTSLFVGATLLAATGGHTDTWIGPYAVVGTTFTLEGMVFGVSSLVGFRRTSDCREAQRAAPAP